MSAPQLNLAWRSLANRGVSVALTTLSIVLSVTLFLGVEKIRTGVRDSFNSTISDTDLIVGARGGSLNLLLYSVFRLGDPTANIGWDSYELIASAPTVAWTVPISLGDSHRGYRVVGTSAAYFEHYRHGRSEPLRLAAGREFAALREAVIGAEVARRLDYAVGQTIHLSHGIGDVSFADHAEHDFTIVGVLAPTGTPVDRSVHVSLQSIEAIHEGWQSGAPPRPGLAADRDGEAESSLVPESITAVLVGVDSPIQVLALQRQINTYRGEALSAIMPGVALSQLWEVLGAGEAAFMAISILVVIVALTGILTALSAGLNERRREMAVLRATGAGSGDIFTLLVLEAAFIAATGALVGVVVTQLAFAVLSPILLARYGLDLATGPGLLDLAVVLGVTGAGALMGAWPAWRARRNALSDGLSIRL